MADPVNFDCNPALITLAAQVAGTVTSANQPNPLNKGIKIYVNITTIGSGNSLTVTLQAIDPVSGNPVALLASAALGSNGITTMTVYPGLTAITNVAANDLLPATWNLKAVVAGANATTATISFCKLI
jgi:hypothetical protein